MEHIAALMLLVACSGDLKDCEEVPSPVVAYESQEICEQALPDELAAVKSDRPLVFGNCLFVDPADLYVDAEIVWDVDRAKGLTAEVNLIPAPGETDNLYAGSPARQPIN